MRRWPATPRKRIWVVRVNRPTRDALPSDALIVGVGQAHPSVDASLGYMIGAMIVGLLGFGAVETSLTTQSVSDVAITWTILLGVLGSRRCWATCLLSGT